MQQTELKLQLTDTAARFIRRMLRFTTSPVAAFRMKVRAGGCSGYAVEFDLADKPAPNSVVWEEAGIRLAFDQASSLLLRGAIIDFADTLSSTGFVIITPEGTGQTCSPTANMVSVDALIRG